MDMSNLREIGIAMLNYAEDNDDRLPGHPQDMAQYLVVIEDVCITPYLEEDVVIDRGSSDGSALRYCGYVFLNLGSDLNDIEKPSEWILAYTAKVIPEQSTRSVLFADSQVEQWEEERLRAALPDGVDVEALDGP
jgi:hypothetical protein